MSRGIRLTPSPPEPNSEDVEWTLILFPMLTLGGMLIAFTGSRWLTVLQPGLHEIPKPCVQTILVFAMIFSLSLYGCMKRKAARYFKRSEVQHKSSCRIQLLFVFLFALGSAVFDAVKVVCVCLCLSEVAGYREITSAIFHVVQACFCFLQLIFLGSYQQFRCIRHAPQIMILFIFASNVGLWFYILMEETGHSFIENVENDDEFSLFSGQSGVSKLNCINTNTSLHKFISNSNSVFYPIVMEYFLSAAGYLIAMCGIMTKFETNVIQPALELSCDPNHDRGASTPGCVEADEDKGGSCTRREDSATDLKTEEEMKESTSSGYSDRAIDFTNLASPADSESSARSISSIETQGGVPVQKTTEVTMSRLNSASEHDSSIATGQEYVHVRSPRSKYGSIQTTLDEPEEFDVADSHLLLLQEHQQSKFNLCLLILVVPAFLASLSQVLIKVVDEKDAVQGLSVFFNAISLVNEIIMLWRFIVGTKMVRSIGKSSPDLDANDLLLYLSVFGIVLYTGFEIFGCVMGFSYIRDRLTIAVIILRFVVGLLRMFTLAFQTHILVKGNHLKVQEKDTNEEFKYILLFLFASNLNLWMTDSFLPKLQETSLFNVQHFVFGKTGWNFVSQILYPLAIFYRIHSAIMATEVISEMYTKYWCC